MPTNQSYGDIFLNKDFSFWITLAYVQLTKIPTRIVDSLSLWHTNTFFLNHNNFSLVYSQVLILTLVWQYKIFKILQVSQSLKFSLFKYQNITQSLWTVVYFIIDNNLYVFLFKEGWIRKQSHRHQSNTVKHLGVWDVGPLLFLRVPKVLSASSLLLSHPQLIEFVSYVQAGSTSQVILSLTVVLWYWHLEIAGVCTENGLDFHQ